MINTMWKTLQKSWANNGRLKFIIVALGIFFSYFIVGILQEKTMRGSYDGDKYNGPITIALVQNFLAFLIIKSEYTNFIDFPLYFKF